ncbi:hypothetical protein BX600DRAFT_453527, partial [Xylariales sp. PMI_506]
MGLNTTSGYIIRVPSHSYIKGKQIMLYRPEHICHLTSSWAHLYLEEKHSVHWHPIKGAQKYHVCKYCGSQFRFWIPGEGVREWMGVMPEQRHKRIDISKYNGYWWPFPTTEPASFFERKLSNVKRAKDGRIKAWRRKEDTARGLLDEVLAEEVDRLDPDYVGYAKKRGLDCETSKTAMQWPNHRGVSVASAESAEQQDLIRLGLLTQKDALNDMEEEVQHSSNSIPHFVIRWTVDKKTMKSKVRSEGCPAEGAESAAPKDERPSHLPLDIADGFELISLYEDTDDEVLSVVSWSGI